MSGAFCFPIHFRRFSGQALPFCAFRLVNCRRARESPARLGHKSRNSSGRTLPHSRQLPGTYRSGSTNRETIMEEQIAALTAELAAMKDSMAGLNKTTAETF